MNDALKEVVFEELTDASRRAEGGGGFLPAVPKLFLSLTFQVKQLANVAGLPGIVKGSFGMPDIHSGYGFAIGNVRTAREFCNSLR